MYAFNLGISFRVLAEKHADKAALLFPDEKPCSFGELESFSNRLAAWLAGHGLSMGLVIAIQNDKTTFGFAAMLACLKLGIIYTNFDYENPKERLSRIFQTAKPDMVLSDRKITDTVRELCQEMKIPYRDYSDDAFRAEVEREDGAISEEILSRVSGENPAYIMYTSGSTGIPKGVLIKHSSLLNLVDWAWETYGLAEDDILTNVNPIYFDNSVFDFYCSLFNGLTMAAFPKAITAQPKKLLEHIDRLGCTLWFSVPSFLIYLTNLKLLKPDTFKSIRAFAFGGEAYPKELLRKLYDLYARRARFFNVYGPTEGTCICSAHPIAPEDFEEEHSLITLGRIADNFSYRILNEDGRPSAVGELSLLGPQLALGYYNDPERTAKSFVQDPLTTAYPRTMYRTGDLVEEINGRLYFKGRVDHQIKHMGYRIELEEIEAGLIKLPYVRQCAVVHGRTEAGLSRLIAFLALEGEPPEEKMIRTELREYLPAYMIPGSFSFIDELPKNPNGKVDRVALKGVAGLP